MIPIFILINLPLECFISGCCHILPLHRSGLYRLGRRCTGAASEQHFLSVARAAAQENTQNTEETRKGETALWFIEECLERSIREGNSSFYCFFILPTPSKNVLNGEEAGTWVHLRTLLRISSPVSGWCWQIPSVAGWELNWWEWNTCHVWEQALVSDTGPALPATHWSSPVQHPWEKGASSTAPGRTFHLKTGHTTLRGVTRSSKTAAISPFLYSTFTQGFNHCFAASCEMPEKHLLWEQSICPL